MTKQNSDAMPAKSIRLTSEQWESCDRLYRQLGLQSRNDFIRDAIDFYIAWQSRESVERYLTPALESVIGAKIRDTEERLARILFKLAVDQNLLARFLARYDGYDDDEYEDDDDEYSEDDDDDDEEEDDDEYSEDDDDDEDEYEDEE